MTSTVSTPRAAKPAANSRPALPSRSASLITGIALVFMMALSAFASFGMMESLVVPGDASATTANIVASETLFRLGIAAFLGIVVLDLIVAASLRAVFASVNESVAAAAGWFRVAYSAAFLVAICFLAIALTTLDQPELVLASVTAFTFIWEISLIAVGVHLLLIGYLAFRSGFVPRVIAILLFIAGAGYTIDGFMVALVAQPPFVLTTYTFVGESVLTIWLLILGARRRAVTGR